MCRPTHRTLRDEYDKLEHLLRVKGIDPDEFLNQKAGDDEEGEDGNYSECSDCSCESCCGENCRDENASTSDNQTTERSDEASSSVENGKKTDDRHKVEVQHLSAQQKNCADEQLKKNVKERNNVRIRNFN